MTGAILGGSSVHQAAKLQMIIMFMITANVVLASVFITCTAILMVVDQEHRIRSDRIDNKKPVIDRIKDWNVGELSAGLSKSFNWRTRKPRIRGGEADRIDNKKPVIDRIKDWNVGELSASLSKSFNWRTRKPRTGGGEADLELNERLLTLES